MQKRTKQLAFDINNKNKNLTIATYASLSKHVLAKIIKELNGSNDASEQARVYKTIFTHLNNRLI